MNKRSFDLASADSNDRYKLLSGLVIPRPIGWIGTRSADGSFNLAPFSFFNVVSSDPPVVLFSAGRQMDRTKDSATNAEQSGVFTVNIVSEELALAMSQTSASLGTGDDKFAAAGVTAIMGTMADAPMVAESPANLECRVLEVVTVGGADGNRLVLGEVVMIHVREDALDGTRVDPDAIRAVGRLAGSSYVTTRDRFELDRPR